MAVEAKDIAAWLSTNIASLFKPNSLDKVSVCKIPSTSAWVEFEALRASLAKLNLEFCAKATENAAAFL